MLTCPICKNELLRSNSVYCCNKNHSFDISKSGYVNLLLSNSAKNHGDNKLMVNARKAFLEKGYYEFLSDALCNQVDKYSKPGDFILDAGCGEGYYTNRLGKKNVVGIDISKYAIDFAAKKNKDILFAVASVFNIPVADGSCDIFLNLFSPFCEGEAVRVLKPDGIMIMVIPSKRHLWGLKQIYEQPYENEVKDYLLPCFELCEKVFIEDKITIYNNEDIRNLFMMTPYFYKTSKEDADKLNNLESLTTELQFEILVYRVKP